MTAFKLHFRILLSAGRIEIPVSSLPLHIGSIYESEQTKHISRQCKIIHMIKHLIFNLLFDALVSFISNHKFSVFASISKFMEPSNSLVLAWSGQHRCGWLVCICESEFPRKFVSLSCSSNEHFTQWFFQFPTLGLKQSLYLKKTNQLYSAVIQFIVTYFLSLSYIKFNPI